MLDLTTATVVVPPDADGLWGQAAQVLIEEVADRTGVCWPLVGGGAGAAKPAVVFERRAAGASGGTEGYRVETLDGEVRLSGASPRALLFAAGALLRHLDMRAGGVRLPRPLQIDTAPRYPLRGHQLGYRPKNNTYDAWSPAQFDRYIRDLALFGGNTIELLPPRTDDADTNPLMRTPKEELLARVTETLRRYDLVSGLWYPLMAEDYVGAEGVAAELAAADAVFALCARLDYIFVPTGDPGHLAPEPLLAFLARLAAVLRQRHPGAEVWISAQGFAPPKLAELFSRLRNDAPDWLTGVVYGPWTACTLPEMRQAVPERYALRLYPDITHTMHCQFPAPDWDPAFMATLGREPINPQPRMQAEILRHHAPGTLGFVTYSEGANDDVNKFVWTALGWDPDADVGEVLRQYGRLLVGARHGEGVAQGLLALERNWAGPLVANTQVPVTLQQLQAIEAAATPEELGNWRLQSMLYRGYFDAYVRRRLIAAVAGAEQVRDWISRAPAVGADVAIAGARQALDRAADEPVAPHWRSRIHALGDALFGSIGMQLSVAKHGAANTERGANLDTLDVPLGDGPWLAAVLEDIATLPTEAERARALAELDHVHSPGPGGFLDDLGNPLAQPHLDTRPLPPHDLEFQDSAWLVPTFGTRRPANPPQPVLWQTAAETLYGAPLVLSYDHLDPGTRYRVRVLYHGRYRAAVSLEAGGVLLHGPLRPTNPPAPVAFAVPQEATADGRLTLTWRLHEGRGVQVAAVWLEPEAEDGPDGAR